ncbi:hypothetical protein [Shewanella fidelis]|uniref:hypothetical protein n=1 Tax=Shewanella fidelis TaxID=173509 RepID=UPI0006865984|nr:hypothetical protein [Shewanella fidelis]
MDNTVISTPTVINTFPKLGYWVIFFNIGLICSLSSNLDNFWGYASLVLPCSVSIIIVRLCWQQRVIFGGSKVSFIKMQQNSDFSLPTSLSLHYQDIDSVRLIGDHLFIHSAKGKINFPLRVKSRLAKKLKQAFEAKGITFEVNSCIL